MKTILAPKGPLVALAKYFGAFVFVFLVFWFLYWLERKYLKK